MTITPATTLAELEVEKAALGITHVALDINGETRTAHALTNVGIHASGQGPDEASALEACFRVIRRKLGARLAAKPVSSSK